MINNNSFYKQQLYDLIKMYLSKKIDTQYFCDTFEDIYNLKLNKNELSSAEHKIFDRIFDRVVWYSPYEKERDEIPNYLGDSQILEIVNVAYKELNIIL